MKKLVTAIVAIVGSLAALHAQEVYRPGNGVTLPTVVTQVQPQYTPEAMAARIEGVVGLNTVVQADGTVGEVKVTQSLDRTLGLDREAVKAMKQWTFKPGTKDGKPVAVSVDIRMKFTLQ